METGTVPHLSRSRSEWAAPENRDALHPVLLNPIEELFWRLEESSAGLFRPAIRMGVDGDIEEQFLVPALQSLQRRHPRLRTVIRKGDDGRPRYDFGDPVPPIPYRIVESADEDPPWRDELRQLTQNTFPPAGPLLAMTVLRDRSRRRCELLLAAHHSIADGMSLVMLAGDLLAAYSAAETGRPIPGPPAMPLMLPARAAISGGWLAHLRLLRRFVRIQNQESRLRQAAIPLASGSAPQSEWAYWTYPPEDTLALVRRCRRERVSLGAALVAMVFCGLAECLPTGEHVFKYQLPFDLRAALAVTPRDLGCFVSIMNEFCRTQRRPELWNLARRVHGDSETFLRHGGPAFNYNLAPALIAFQKLMEPLRRHAGSSSNSPSGSAKRATLFATNYGVVNIRGAYGSLRPQECTLIFRSGPSGPLLVLEALILGRRLNIGLAADGLERSFWERLQAAVRNHLQSAMGDSPRGAGVDGLEAG